MKGWVYILECADGSYYTGSTNNLDLRLAQHKNGEGANHTKKRLPVKLVYAEEFDRIDEAFYREKQIQGWSRKKKEALIKGESSRLPELSKNYTQFPRTVSSSVASAGSATDGVDSNNSVSGNTTLPAPVNTLPEPITTLPEPITTLPEPITTLPELVEGNDKLIQ